MISPCRQSPAVCGKAQPQVHDSSRSRLKKEAQLLLCSWERCQKYRALPSAGLSQPKITAIHVLTKLSLEKLTRKRSRKSAPRGLKSLSPWPVGEKRKRCSGSRALFHPPCLHKATLGDKGRRGALTCHTSATHC